MSIYKTEHYVHLKNYEYKLSAAYGASYAAILYSKAVVSNLIDYLSAGGSVDEALIEMKKLYEDLNR